MFLEISIEEDVPMASYNLKEKYVRDLKLEHFAIFPENLIKPFILGTSRENEMALDLFMCTGKKLKFP